MAKTAEEIIREVTGVEVRTPDSNILCERSEMEQCMREFAAQEVEAYKIRLKAEVELRLGNSDEIDPIHNIIDAVK